MENKIRITKQNLIKDIAKQGNMNKDDVGKIYDLLEEKIFNLLSSTNDEHDVEIRLFNGISLDGVYVPEKSKKNNLTGKVSFVSSKIKPKFSITRTYCERLNSVYNE